jgi:sialic acid synthase SpsE/quercetin dioxygenase-like cupin family protein
MTTRIPKPLFIFEMANNHMGSLEHGLTIIRRFFEISRDFPFHFGFKLQYRHLDTFIHPDFKGREDVKYVKRFSETKLGEDELLALAEEIKKLGFVAICTAFDEKSVDLIEKHGFEIIKIASCSFTDWPLLERVVQSDKPIIASTAGATLEEIDKVVSFLEHRGKDFALMHCVAEYPTLAKNQQLNQIDLLHSRYEGVRVGYSTHEPPGEADSVKIAIAKGASIFEKHVGVARGDISLNAYSATPEQARLWLAAAQRAYELCGGAGSRAESNAQELASLFNLRRGVFAGQAMVSGEKIGVGKVFLAIPATPGQLTANELSKYTDFYATVYIQANAPVMVDKINRVENQERILNVVQRIKAIVKTSGVVVPSQVELEISHHYGWDRFDEFGLTMLTVVNREYCKKLIILLPGQQHPEQYHQVKEETFHVLYGQVGIKLDGVPRIVQPGDVVTIERGVKHSFASLSGAVIEEISSTHAQSDSHYTDPEISQNRQRKTFITYWLD